MLALLGGCALAPSVPAPPGDSIELTSVPFFPQEAYQCGPAALATALGHSGIAADPEQLATTMYLPGRQGSLQAELVSTARQWRRVPLPTAPSSEALLQELYAGRPVIVLLNLGIAALPRWHYAVVVGWDAKGARWILRSGTERRHRERHASFMRQWRGGDFWSRLVLAPGELPASIAPRDLLQALADSEARLASADALATWEAAAARWPDDDTILFATANAAVRDGQRARAAGLFRRLLARAPDHLAARNNYADLLLGSGCPEAAAEVVAPLLQQPDTLAGPLAKTLRETVTSVQGASSGTGCALELSDD